MNRQGECGVVGVVGQPWPKGSGVVPSTGMVGILIGELGC